jgi:hypothetical protein
MIVIITDFARPIPAFASSLLRSGWPHPCLPEPSALAGSQFHWPNSRPLTLTQSIDDLVGAREPESVLKNMS